MTRPAGIIMVQTNSSIKVGTLRVGRACEKCDTCKAGSGDSGVFLVSHSGLLKIEMISFLLEAANFQ